MSLTVKELARNLAVAPDKILDDYTVRIVHDGKAYKTSVPYVDPLTNSLLFEVEAEIDLTLHETNEPVDDFARQRARTRRRERLNV